MDTGHGCTAIPGKDISIHIIWVITDLDNPATKHHRAQHWKILTCSCGRGWVDKIFNIGGNNLNQSRFMNTMDE